MIGQPRRHSWSARFTGDLLEAAVNDEPSLAALGGRPGRISKKAGGDPSDKEQEEQKSDKKGPSVLLSEIQRVTHGTFKMDGRWGAIARAKLRFTTLSAIREAYSRTFADNTETIDEVLARDALDSLSVVRNVLVHSGGKADADYIESLGFAPAAPKLTTNEPLPINGKLVGDILGPAIIAGCDLLEAVESWLETHGK